MFRLDCETQFNWWKKNYESFATVFCVSDCVKVARNLFFTKFFCRINRKQCGVTSWYIDTVVLWTVCLQFTTSKRKFTYDCKSGQWTGNTLSVNFCSLFWRVMQISYVWNILEIIWENEPNEIFHHSQPLEMNRLKWNLLSKLNC